MNNKLITLIPLIGLSVAFIVVTLLVIITKGSNVSLIKKKLKLGAAIIMITSYFTSCSSPQIEMCYDVAPAPAEVTISNEVGEYNTITINLLTEQSISGTIYDYSQRSYSYSISAIDDNENTDEYNEEKFILQDEIIINEEALEDGGMPFVITLSSVITPGTYLLKIYDVTVEYQSDYNIIENYRLNITTD